MKMGRAGSPLVPRRRPQAGKSWDPPSQNAEKGDEAGRYGDVAVAMSADVLKQFGVMDMGLRNQQCGHANTGRDL